MKNKKSDNNKQGLLKPINLRFVFQIAGILSLMLIYIFQWAQMIASPSLRTGTDFMAFYSAGRIAQEYGWSKVYDGDLQREIQQGLVGFELAEEQPLIFIHLPYIVPILKFITDANFVTSFIRWAILMLAVCVLASFSLFRTISHSETVSGNPVLFLGGVILFFPFFQSLLLGQDTAVLLLGTVFWCTGILKKQHWVTAVGLALTTIRPHICIVLLLPVLFKTPKLWFPFFAAAGFLMFSSFMLVGMEGTIAFLRAIQISATGTGYGTNESGMLNLIGLVLRLFPALDEIAVHYMGWAGYIAGICAACLLWQKANAPDWNLLGITIVLALFFAPHLHYHDLTLLVIPLAFLSVRHEHFPELPLVVSGLLIVFKPLYFVLPYVLFVALIWWMSQGKKTRSEAIY
jgi:hypothetical protein